jgi:hypothetical protein
MAFNWVVYVLLMIFLVYFCPFIVAVALALPMAAFILVLSN